MLDPSIISQMFIHTSPKSLVEPLRDFLDSWTIDEDDDNGMFSIPTPSNSLHSSKLFVTSFPKPVI